MKSVERIQQIVEKSEARKQKLVAKIEGLREEAKHLQSEKENALQEAIINDTSVDKKLEKDLNKVMDEIADKQKELQQIDGAVVSQIQKAKDDVDRERNEYVKSHSEEFRKLFDTINEAKLSYLEAVIEYKTKKDNFDRNYRLQFRETEERVGLRPKDTHYTYGLSITQRSQIKGNYSPLLFNDEIREAFVNKKLHFDTNANKEAFKKK